VHWERSAAVRTFCPDQIDWSGPGLWAPAGHLAIVKDPGIETLLEGPLGAALILGHFYFTQRLENELIAPVCARLASGALITRSDFTQDALRLGCDESYHALLCMQFGTQVRALSGLNQPAFGEPRFLRRVREMRKALQGRVAAADVDLTAAAISETIVTRTLGEDWHDPKVRAPIRSFLKMHHLDEARHSAFFTQALAFAWSRWDASTRDAIETAWDGLVEAFAAPDLEMMAVAFDGRVDPQVAASLLDMLLAESGQLAATADTRLTRRALSFAKNAMGQQGRG
jgi:hypothetical protein